MNIESVEIDNFLRIARMRLDLTGNVVHIVCGHNEAGKTSLQEAIRFCLLGETQRVKLKGEYKLMIKDGSAAGAVRMTVDGKVLERDIQTGRGTAEEFVWPDALEYLLDATRYGWLNEKARRKFMYALMEITVQHEDVRRRLIDDHKIPDYMVDLIMPMLKSGFDSAYEFSREKTSEARGGWKAITGETYGNQKAAGWTPAPPDIITDVAEHAELVGEQAKLEKRVEELAEEMGKSKSGDYMALGHLLNCPSCDARICIDNSHPTPVRVVTPEEEQRSMQDAQQMAADLESPTLAAFEDAKAARNQGRELLDAINMQNARQENKDDIAQQAATYHTQVVQWSQAVTALAPTGIPAEMISEKIKPMNDRLRETAVQTGWPQVALTADMKIMVDNRLFQLQSESSQWRAQAAIAEAVSFISGVGIVVLDRVDVLDINNRLALIRWALKIAGSHNNVLLIGTFKEPPKVPNTISVHWLEDGKIAEAEAA
jgi:hypothetical protein